MTTTPPHTSDSPAQLPGSPSVADDATPTPPPRRTGISGRVLYPLLAIAFALLLALWWFVYTDVQQLRVETARRLQSSEAFSTSTQAALKGIQTTVKDVQATVATLESRQAEAQSQQIALEQLYQDLNKSRDDWTLAEIEQVLSTAAQQLQLAGNVQGGLIALQNADRLLAQSDRPQFVAIRSAIARDIERLKALPQVDLTGTALRLDSVISQVDSLPLLSAEKPAAPQSEPKAPTRISADAGSSDADWLARLQEQWRSLVAEMMVELRQVVRVRSVETPDALLMSPTESFYARENLKLRLLNARLALLSRNEPAFRGDLIAAQQIVTRYFDTRARQTQTVQTLLKQVQNNNLSIEMPTLSESLTAVRQYKVQP